MLIMSVDRNRKQTARSPLKGMFLPILLPNRSGAVALGHVDHLFIEMFLRFRFALRRNLADVSVVYAAGAVEYHERARHALEIPRRQLDFVDILHEEPFDNRNFLRCLPFPVSIDSFRLEIDRLLSSFCHWCALLTVNRKFVATILFRKLIYNVRHLNLSFPRRRESRLF